MAVVTGKDHTGVKQWEFNEYDFCEVDEDIDVLEHHASIVKNVRDQLWDAEKSFDWCVPNCPEFEEHWSDFVDAIFVARKEVDAAVSILSDSIEVAEKQPKAAAIERIKNEWMDGERFYVEGE